MSPVAITVGVLEEVPGVRVGESSHYAVRAMFRQKEQGWEPFPNYCETQTCLATLTSRYPAGLKWIISYQGQPLGTVSASTPRDFAYYADVGLQTVNDASRIPEVGSPSIDYSGYQETPVHRPLLATVGATRLAGSRSEWKPHEPAPLDLDRLWPSFSRLIPLIDDCRLDAKGEYIPSNGRPPHRDELEIAAVWADRSGDELLDARIRRAAFKDCDGPQDHPSEHWFFRDAKGDLRSLPGQRADNSTESAARTSRAQPVMPLDFVDLLGDGRDVVLFLLAGDDAGGYALYFDNFQKVTAYTWIYH